MKGVKAKIIHMIARLFFPGKKVCMGWMAVLSRKKSLHGVDSWWQQNAFMN